MKSAIDSFDPYAYIKDRATEPAPTFDNHLIAPVQWLQGLEVLQFMARPNDADPQRWAQIVADSENFVRAWASTAHDLGWTVGNVFGFDPAQPQGRLGMIFSVRGDTVAALDADRAYIRGQGTRRWRARDTMPDNSRPIWDYQGSNI